MKATIQSPGIAAEFDSGQANLVLICWMDKTISFKPNMKKKKIKASDLVKKCSLQVGKNNKQLLGN